MPWPSVRRRFIPDVSVVRSNCQGEIGHGVRLQISTGRATSRKNCLCGIEATSGQCIASEVDLNCTGLFVSQMTRIS